MAKVLALDNATGQVKELDVFATTDTIPTSNLNATTSGTDTTPGRVWRTNDLVKTTSATDTTAGRVLKVGDFGLPTAVVVTDANSIVTGGIYNLGSPYTNGPTANFYHIVHTQAVTTATQIAIQSNTSATPKSYTRAWNSTNGWTSWAEVATSANSLGQAQTWQNVTANRALNTTYTNSTGRPIQIKVGCITTAASGMQIFIDGSGTSLPGGQSPNIPENSAIIPNGATYKALNNAGTASNLTWWELR